MKTKSIPLSHKVFRVFMSVVFITGMSAFPNLAYADPTVEDEVVENVDAIGGDTGDVVDEAVPADYGDAVVEDAGDEVPTYSLMGEDDVTYVAQIGATSYATLAEAIAAVPADGSATTITMLNDEAVTTGITIASGQNIVLDLNGKTVAGVFNSGTTSALITNKGTLTVNDGVGGGQLTSSADPYWVYSEQDPGGYASNLIRNEGTLTVNGGSLYNASPGSACYAIDNYSAGKVTINGGVIDAKKASAIRLFYNNGGSIDVTGGTIGHYTSDDDCTYMGIQVMSGNNADVNISGGTIAGNYAFYTTGVGDSSVRISGGTFDGYVGLGSTSSNDNLISGGEFLEWVGTFGSHTGFITGGTFAEEVDEACIADGFMRGEDGTIVAKPLEIAPIANATYSGADQTPALTVTYGDATLTQDTDYTVSWNPSEIVNAGTYTATVTGKGTYEGKSGTATFTIDPVSARKAIDSISAADKTFTGSAISPELTFVAEGNPLALVEGKDYSVSCINNVNAGTATATITYAGNYTGSDPVTFAINKASFEDVTVTLDPANYFLQDDATYRPDVTVKLGDYTLDASEYTVSYPEVTGAGSYDVTVASTEKNLTAGSKTASFQVSSIVAKIGDTNYATLAEAIAAVPADGTPTTITMVADTEIDVTNSPLTIAAGKNVVLDLNGKTATGNCAGGATSAFITNKGTLTINDSSGDDSGKLVGGADDTWTWDGSDDYSGSYASNLIRNEGTLTVNGGTLYNASSGSATYAIDNYSAGKVTVNGGVIDSKKASAIRMFYNNGGSIDVTGGTIGHYNSADDYSYMGIQVMGGTNADVTISGGTIAGQYAFYSNATGDSSVSISDGTLDGYVGFASAGPSDISISGGQFTAWVGTWGSQTGFISGGKFAVAPDVECCADGLYPVKADDADYPYVLGAAVALVDGIGYATFADAVEATGAAESQVITLVADIEGDYTLAVDETLKVALDGKALTVKAPEGYVVQSSTEDGVTTYTLAVSVAKIGDTGYASLQAAIDASHDMSGDVTVELLADVAEVAVVHQKADLNLTIDGGGKTITGQVYIDGDGRYEGTDTLTITNTKFAYDSATYDDAFIDVPNTKTAGKPYTTGKYNYAHNITVSNCEFAGSGETTVAFRVASGAGANGVTLQGLTVSGGHSFAQLVGVKDLTIAGCAVSGTKNGINISGGDGTGTISGSTLAASGYTVRLKDASGMAVTLSENEFSGDEGLVSSATSGGTITVESGKYAGPLPTDGTKFTVTGGLFTIQPSVDVCGEGVYPIANTDEATQDAYPYTVGAAVALVDGLGYASFADAVAVANNGEKVITLVGDAGTYTMESTDQVLKVNKNGNTLTVKAPEGPYVLVSSTPVEGVITYSLVDADLEFTNSSGATSYKAWSSAAISNSGTYKLLRNVTASARIVPGISASSVTLDLNGYTLTSTASDNGIVLSRVGTTNAHKSFSIVDSSENGGGKFVVNPSANQAIQVTGKFNDVTIGEGVTIDGNCVAMLSENQTLTVNGTINGGSDFAIATNGSSTKNSTININDGAVLTSDIAAMYLPGNEGVVTNVKGAEITGSTGIEIRGGTLNIFDDAKITATGAFSEAANDNGTTINGAAVAVSQHTTNLPINVTVSGGTLKGAKALYEVDLQDEVTEGVSISVTDGKFDGDVASENVQHFITGGLFTIQPSVDVCGEGVYPIANTDEATKDAYPYTVGAAVALVDGLGYASFADAAAAANNGEKVITLVADVTDDYTLATNESLQVALNGKTLPVKAPEGYVVQSSTEDGVTTYTLAVSVAKIGDTGYASLQAAIDASHDMSGDVTVELLADVTEVAVVHQKADLNLTINGGGKTITGQIYIDGDGRYNGTDTLTITNTKFAYDSATYDDAFINVPNTKTAGKPYTTDKYNYAHNITVSGCEFTGSGTTTVAFRVASGAGANKVTLQDLVVTGGHSFAQLVGVKDLRITGCDVSGTKNGINIDGGDGTGFIAGSKLVANADEGYTVRVQRGSAMEVTLSGNEFSGGEGLISTATGGGTITVESGKYAGPLPTDGTKFTVTGGLFTVSPVEAVCGKDSVGNQLYPMASDDPDYPFTVATGPVAETGGMYFATLAGAIEAANAGDTVKLLKNTSENVTVGKAITLDMGGNELSSNHSELITVTSSGDLKITGNGKITGPENGQAFDAEALIYVEGGKLAIENGTLTATGEGSDGMYGVYVLNGGAATFGTAADSEAGTPAAGPTITSHFAAIGTNNTTAPATVTVYGGTYTANAAPSDSDWWSYFCAPVYAASAGTFDLQGGTFNGYYGISSRYANVDQDITLGGVTLNASSGTQVFVDDQTGTETEDIDRHIYSAVDTLTLSGAYAWGSVADSDPMAYEVVEAVASVTHGDTVTYFATLQAAVNAAVDGDTVKLLKDTTEYVNIYSSDAKAIAVDLGGKKLTAPSQNNSARALRVSGQNVQVLVKNGSIAKNDTAGNTGQRTAVFVENRADVTFEDVTITSAIDGIQAKGTMYQGKATTITLKGSTSVEVSSGVALNLSEAATANVQSRALISATTGAAVYATDNAVINIQGGTLTSGSGPNGGVTVTTRDNATLNMSGGTVQNTGTEAGGSHYIAAIFVYGTGDSTISGGTVTAAAGNAVIAPTKTGSLTISGDNTTIENAGSVATIVSGWRNYTSAGNVIINGGVIENTGAGATLELNYESSTITINGGYFSDAAGNGEGFTRKDDQTLVKVVGGYYDGYYKLGDAVCSIGDNLYASIGEAENSGDTSSNTIKLLKDVDEYVYIDSNWTLDLNGHTVSHTGWVTLFLASGHTLTIVDSSEAKTGKVITDASGSTEPRRCAIYSMQSSVKVEGGTIECDDGYGIYAADVSGQITINDGATIIGAPGKSLFSSEAANGRIVIDGGLFSDDVGNARRFSKPAGQVLVKIVSGDNAGLFQLGIAVAQIGTTNYASLIDAIADAESGDTVKLLVNDEESVTIGKSITLDLGGKTLTSAGNTVSVTGSTTEVTIENGTLTSTNEGEQHALDIDDATVVVDGATIVAGKCTTVYAYGDGSLVLNSGTIESGSNRAAVLTYDSAGFTMTGGTVKNTAADGTKLGAVRLNSSGASSISGGEITTAGGTGAAVFALKGTLSISGDVAITAGGEGAAVKAGNNSSDHAAVTVGGGVLVNDGEGPSVDVATGSTFAINGGYYSDTAGNGARFERADGKMLMACTDAGHAGLYELGKVVATITSGGETAYFGSLQAAVDAAEDGQTVTLQEDLSGDCALDARVEVDPGAGKSIAIDLNGKTIAVTHTSGNGSAFNIKSGTVTLENGTIDGTGVVEGTEGGVTVADGICLVTVRSGATLNIPADTADETIAMTVDSKNGCCVYPFAGGTVNIAGGTFENRTAEPYAYKDGFQGLTVNQANVAQQLVHITGGTFVGNDPQLGDDNGAAAVETGFVAIPAEGTTAGQNGTYTVVPGGTVSFDVDGGAPAIDDQRVAAGDKVAEPATIPTRAELVFSAWQLDGADYDFDTPMAAGDITLKASWTDAVASITTDGGTAYFASLADAVDASQSGDTIVMLRDDPMGDKTIETSKRFTLDLNGKTVTSTRNGSYPSVRGGVLWLGDGANVVVKDGSADQGGALVSTSQANLNSACIYVSGSATLTVEGGTVQGYNRGIESWGYTTVKGGTVRATAPRGSAIENEWHTTTIAGGTVEGARGIYVGSNCAVNITGGTVRGSLSSIHLNNTLNPAGDVSISGDAVIDRMGADGDYRTFAFAADVPGTRINLSGGYYYDDIAGGSEFDRGGKVIELVEEGQPYAGYYQIVKPNIANAEADPITVVYNGQGQAAEPVLTYEGRTIAGADYIVSSYKKGDEVLEGLPKDAGSYTAVVAATDDGGFRGTKEIAFTIEPKNINDPSIEIIIPTQSYTGKVIVPEHAVVDSETGEQVLLAEGTDYSVAFRDNQYVGNAFADFTGKGNYTGNRTETFLIWVGALPIDDATITVEPEGFVYNGEAKEPSVSITAGAGDDAMTLREDVDYTLTYYNNVNAGTAGVLIMGAGGYTGGTIVEFAIEPATITASLESDAYDYTGGAIAPAVTVTATDGADEPKTWTLGPDEFSVIYSNNTEPGTATATVVPTANYRPTSLTASFTINAPVAKVGDSYFASLQAAIDAAQGGDTVELLADAAENVVVADKTVSIDLGGNTLSSTGGWAVLASGTADVTLSNGTIDAASGGAKTTGASTLTVTDGVLIDAGAYGIFPSDTSTVNVVGGEIHGVFAISTNGLPGQDATINVSGGVIVGDVADSDNYSAGVYLPSGTLNVTDGTISGNEAAIMQRGGTANVSGGKLTYTNTDASHMGSIGDRRLSMPVGVIVTDVVASGYPSAGNAGTVVSEPAILLGPAGGSMVSGFAEGDTAAVTLNEGVMTSEVPAEASIADGCWAQPLGDGTYVIARLATAERPVAVEGLVYNGSLQSGVQVTFEGYSLKSGDVEATDAGGYTAVFKLDEGFVWSDDQGTGDHAVEWSIAKAPATVRADDASKDFGEIDDPELTAEVTGVAAGDELSYTLKRAEGEDAGDYAITVTLGDNPNYNISAAGGTFTIYPATIDSVTVADLVYNGAVQEPVLTVKAGGLTLDPTEYDAIFSPETIKDAGAYTVTVRGKGNYNGEVKDVPFTVARAEIASIDPIDEQAYTGSALKPALTVKDQAGNLVDPSGYTAVYVNNVEPGTADIIVTAKGNYIGSLAGSFVIAKANATFEIAPIADQTYTGEAIEPAVTVTATPADATYEVAYSDNVEVGTARVTVTPTGAFAGEPVTASFNIVAAPVPVDKSALETAIDAATVASEDAIASEDGKNLIDGTEYWAPEDIAALDSAIAAAQQILDKADATQAEVDDAVVALNAAKTAFDAKVKTATVDKAPLQTAITTATAAGDAANVLADTSDVAEGTEYWTPEAKQALDKAIAEAQDVFDDPYATQTEVDEAVAALNAAKTAFDEAKQAVEVDTDPLGNSIAAGQDALASAEDYVVDDSVDGSDIPSGEQYVSPVMQALLDTALDAVDEAVEAAKAVAAKQGKTQAEVDDAKAAIDDALKTLEFIKKAYNDSKTTADVDFSALEAADEAAADSLDDNLPTSADGLQPGAKYVTQEAKDALAAAKAAADAVLSKTDPRATQAEVDEALAALEAAQQAYDDAVQTVSAPEEIDTAELQSATAAAQADFDEPITVIGADDDPSTLDPGTTYVTQADKDALAAAIAAANQVLSAPESQEQVDEATAAIKAAKDAYDAAKITVTADKSALAAAIIAALADAIDAPQISTDGKDVPNGNEWVTQADVDALKKAIDEATEVLNNPNATPGEIAAATGKMNAAKEAFDEAKQTANVDKSALQAAYDAGVAAEDGTPTSVDGGDVADGLKWTTTAEKQAEDNALAAAKKVLDNDKATQAQVDDAVSPMTKATTTYEQAKKLWHRIWGAKAPDTMKGITDRFGKTGVAIVTTDANYRDALAASSFAGKQGAVVLMTAKGSLTPQTKQAIQAAGVKTVYIVGSTNEVSNNVLNALKATPGVANVWRVNGASPSARAIAVAKKTGTPTGTVIIATQNGFEDALSIAPYSYASKTPILYAETNKKLSSATLSYIKGAKVKKAIIVGGPIALPASVDTQLKGAGVTSITRVAGANSYATSYQIAQWATGQLANGNYGTYKGKTLAYIKFQPAVKMSADRLGVSTGQNWLDALAGAALLGKNRSVMLLADSKTAKSNYTLAPQFCKANKAKITTAAYVFGGKLAVQENVWNVLVNSTK